MKNLGQQNGGVWAPLRLLQLHAAGHLFNQMKSTPLYRSAWGLLVLEQLALVLGVGITLHLGQYPYGDGISAVVISPSSGREIINCQKHSE